MCMIDGIDGFWDWWEERQPRAAKPHTCAECGRTIEKGERHAYLVAKFDGRLDTYRTCTHCVAAREWLQKVCGGWLMEGVQEDLEEHWMAYPSIWLARAIIGMRRGWQRFDGTGLMPVLPNPKFHPNTGVPAT